jgi:hypothetical protein
MAAGYFKTNVSVMDEVQAKREAVVITLARPTGRFSPTRS